MRNPFSSCQDENLLFVSLTLGYYGGSCLDPVFSAVMTRKLVVRIIS